MRLSRPASRALSLVGPLLVAPLAQADETAGKAAAPAQVAAPKTPTAGAPAPKGKRAGKAKKTKSDELQMEC